MSLHKAYCPGCIGKKAIEAMLCRECGEIYGDYSEWPGWLKFRYNDYRREAAQDQGVSESETPLNEYEYFCDAEEESDEDDLMTRPAEEMHVSTRPVGDAWWADGCGDVLLPMSPYDNEDMNRQYRESNGIVLAGR